MSRRNKNAKPPEEDRFEIDIFWSDEDDAYIAVIPDIPSTPS